MLPPAPLHPPPPHHPSTPTLTHPNQAPAPRPATMKRAALALAAAALMVLALAAPAAAQSAESRLALVDNFADYCQQLGAAGCADFTVAMLAASDEAAAGQGECAVSAAQQASFAPLSRDPAAWEAFYNKVGLFWRRRTRRLACAHVVRTCFKAPFLAKAAGWRSSIFFRQPTRPNTPPTLNQPLPKNPGL